MLNLSYSFKDQDALLNCYFHIMRIFTVSSDLANEFNAIASETRYDGDILASPYEYNAYHFKRQAETLRELALAFIGNLDEKALDFIRNYCSTSFYYYSPDALMKAVKS